MSASNQPVEHFGPFKSVHARGDYLWAQATVLLWIKEDMLGGFRALDANRRWQAWLAFKEGRPLPFARKAA